MNTESLLKVFWDGDEVSGITTYGYWRGKVVREPVFPKHLWPDDTLIKTSRLYGKEWEVYVCDIRVRTWPRPQDWEEVVSSTLKSIVKADAVVAWCGLEGLFADPPSLFDPKEMSGGVYAVFSRTVGFQCYAYINSTFKALPDEELIKLQELL